MSDNQHDLTEAMTDVRNLLLASTLPDELAQRVIDFVDSNPNPKKLSKQQKLEITELIKELDKYDALELIGLTRA